MRLKRQRRYYHGPAPRPPDIPATLERLRAALTADLWRQRIRQLADTPTDAPTEDSHAPDRREGRR